MNPWIAILVALIAATPPTIAAVWAIISSKKNGVKIQEIHLSINSRMDELLEATKIAARSQGRADEQAAQLEKATG